MKALCFLILTTAAILVADGPGEGDVSRSDLDKLRGTWLTVSLVNDGKTLVDEKAPPKGGPITKLVYDGNTWIIKVGDRTVATGVFKIDATKTPKQLDLTGSLTKDMILASEEMFSIHAGLLPSFL